MEKNHPKISVIIPTYNRENLIVRAVNSVLEQTYKNIEVIIVDDGSTDNTETKIKSIKDKRIQYFKSLNNQGQAKARNTGIKMAKGKYIAFQDSDDVWLPNKLEKQVKLLEDSHEMFGMVYCMFEYQNAEGGAKLAYPPKTVPLSIKTGFIFPNLFAGNLVGMPTVLVRREIFDNVGLFNEKLSCLEDFELVLRIAKNYQIGMIDEVLVHTYFTNSSVSAHKIKEAEVLCQIILSYQEDIQKYNGLKDMFWRVKTAGEKVGALGAVEAMIENTMLQLPQNNNLKKQYIEWLEEERKTFDKNIPIKKKQQDCKEWLEKVFGYLSAGNYEFATKLFYSILLNDNNTVNRYWLDTNSAILDIMFTIHTREAQEKEPSIFRFFSSLTEIKSFYFELKYLLRRFEYDLSDDLKYDIISFLNKYPISSYAMIEFIERCISKKDKVLNVLAVYLFKHNVYDYTIPLLLHAYQKNHEHFETLYNMTYFLYAFNEPEIAIEYANQIKDNHVDAKKLYDIIIQNQDLPSYSEIHSMVWENTYKLPDLKIPDNTQTICFITCVNNERLYEECCHYIDNLIVPKGYVIEKKPIYNAKSMVAGYQQALNESTSLYNVYLHQDAFCINPYFLYEAIYTFEQDNKIGMLGVAGTTEMPCNGKWWMSNKEKYYNLIQDSVASYGYEDDWNINSRYNKKGFQELAVIDGVFMMTSQNIDWRQDLFSGWHFYDASQCMEYHRKGYKISIIKPSALWVLHCGNAGDVLGTDYDEARIAFLKEYINDLE